MGCLTCWAEIWYSGTVDESALQQYCHIKSFKWAQCGRPHQSLDRNCLVYYFDHVWIYSNSCLHTSVTLFVNSCFPFLCRPSGTLWKNQEIKLEDHFWVQRGKKHNKKHPYLSDTPAAERSSKDYSRGWAKEGRMVQQILYQPEKWGKQNGIGRGRKEGKKWIISMVRANQLYYSTGSKLISMCPINTCPWTFSDDRNYIMVLLISL